MELQAYINWSKLCDACYFQHYITRSHQKFKQAIFKCYPSFAGRSKNIRVKSLHLRPSATAAKNGCSSLTGCSLSGYSHYGLKWAAWLSPLWYKHLPIVIAVLLLRAEERLHAAKKDRDYDAFSSLLIMLWVYNAIRSFRSFDKDVP